MKNWLLLLGAVVAIVASYAAVTFGLAGDAGFNSHTLASIALPALVSALVVIVYLYYRARLRATLGTVNELNTQLIRKEIEIDHLSTMDELTGLATRRSFDETLSVEFERCRRHGRNLALLLIEVDDLIAIGERIGKLGKGFLLSEVAGVVHNIVRVNDVAARYTPEILALLLPEANEAQARAVGEKLREHMRNEKFLLRRYEVDAILNLTLGVAAVPAREVETAEQFREAAELSLFDAKHQRTASEPVPPAVASHPSSDETRETAVSPLERKAG